MPTPEKILSGMRCTRSEFRDIFSTAQSRIGIRDQVAFEAIAPTETGNISFLIALNYSQNHGFLDEIRNLIVKLNLEDGTLAQEMVQSATTEEPGKSTLEGILNLAAGFDLPHEAYRGLNKGMRMTGKIILDGNPRGTCILVQPNMVLTSWHVLKDLFEIENGTYQPIKDIQNEIVIEFEDFLSLVGTNRSSASKKAIYHAHKDWCVSFCDCHKEEINDLLPINLEELAGFWDYVIVRLEQSPGHERDWQRLERAENVPAIDEKIIVFQHPDGHGLRMHDRLIARSNPENKLVFPGLRFLHSVNTYNGSSGGPCFNKNFNFFGIHQGVWDAGGTHMKLNRGIPAVCINKHFQDSEIRLLPHEGDKDGFWRIPGATGFTPIVGCDDFKDDVLNATSDDQVRMILVSGSPGHGKSFRLQVLKSILPASNHLLIELKASSITKMDAAELAKEIVSLAGNPNLQIPDQEETNSTSTVWIKSALVPAIMGEIQSLKLDRMVWITIADLNKFHFENDNASILLLELYEQLNYQDWLRFVLDDMQMKLPVGIQQLAKRVIVKEINYEQVVAFFMRLNLSTKLNLDDGAIVTAAKDVYARYEITYAAEPNNGASAIHTELNFKAKHVFKGIIKD